MDSSDSPAASRPQPQGLGGWLLALVILQCFFLLFEGFGTFTFVVNFVVGVPGVPSARLAYFLMVVLHGSLLLAAAFATYLLAERRARFVKIFSLQLLIFAAVPLVEMLVLLITLDGWSFVSPKLLLRIVAHILIAIGLRLYLESSVRVRNTFVR